MGKDKEPGVESLFATRRAALGMTAAMTAGLLTEKALSPDSAHAETGLQPLITNSIYEADAYGNIAIGSPFVGIVPGSKAEDAR